MKRLLTLFFASTVAFLISSCATNYPIQKRLIGTWKPEKVEKYNMSTPRTPATGTTGKIKSDAGKANPTISPAEPSRAEGQIARLIETQLRSTLILNSDKTAITDYRGKTIHATWKLKKKGTQLIATGKETGKKMTFDILRVNDTSAVVVEHFPIGNLKITFKKEKK